MSFTTGAEPNFTVPESALTAPESLTRAVPSARQKASASSGSVRLHCGHRFIKAMLEIQGCVLIEFRGIHFLEQSRESRVVSESVKLRVDRKPLHVNPAFAKISLEACERRIFVAESELGRRQIITLHISVS